MNRPLPLLITAALTAGLVAVTLAAEGVEVTGPVEHIYATHDGTDLKAYVFFPAPDTLKGKRSAIVVFHGGGWHIGAPEWGFSRARHFAEKGMVAVSAQYRLSDQKTITPLEAMADARAVIRWMRSNADSLGIMPNRIAAYGWSAGAHLATCAAIFDDSPSDSALSCAPDALVLFSPAVSLEGDRWVQRLLAERANAADISPDLHIRQGLPPTAVFQGRTDTVTPLAGTQRFCDRMRAAGNRCELHVYDGVGHLFTPSTEPDNEMPNPDPEVQATAYREADAFLVSLGFMSDDSNKTPREKGGGVAAEIVTRSVITAETVGDLHKAGVIRTDAEVASASFSPDGHLLATADYGGAVRLWSMATMEETLMVKPSGSMVWGASFSHDAALLAYWGLEGLHLWDVASCKVVKTIDTHGDYPTVAAFSTDGRMLVTGSLDGVIEVWESATGKRRAAVEVLDGVTMSLEYSPDGRFLAVGGAAGDTRILLLDPETLEERLTLLGQKTDVHAICFRPDMEVFTSTGPRGVVITWDIDLAEPSAATDDYPGNLFAADYSPDGSLFVVADDLGLVRIMDGTSGEEVHGLEHSGNGQVAAFSPDGTVLATTGEKNEVVIWALK